MENYIKFKKELNKKFMEFLKKNDTHSLSGYISFGKIEQKPIKLNYYGDDYDTIIDMIYIDNEDEIIVENHFEYNGETINDTTPFTHFNNDEMKEIMKLCNAEY